MQRINLRASITIAVLTTLFLYLYVQHNGRDFLRSQSWSFFKPSHPQTPEDGVYKMLDAARTGDAAKYMDCFSGKMRDQLLQVIKEASSARFSKYLVEQNSSFTGVALSGGQNIEGGDGACVRVEYVYGARNEVQDLYLRQEGGQWKIFRVAGSEQIKTLIPYGTAVTD